MKAARIIVLGIALGAGLIAARLASQEPSTPPVSTQAEAPALDTTDILVAKSDIDLGNPLKAANLGWEAWPTKNISSQYIRKNGNPNQLEEITGSVARSPFFAGEPIRSSKLIKGNGSGYMSMILPAGMRATATEITPELGAGGFILPNDKVDVILTGAEKGDDGKEFYRSRTILTDVRVLAIDQAIEEKPGQKTAAGKIATLALTPRDAEKIALARRLGTLSLVLRSGAEQNETQEDVATLQRPEYPTFVRFGRVTNQ